METHRYAVTIKRPDQNNLSGLSQTAKYDYLKQYTHNVQNKILEWLEQRNLRNEVISVGPTTAFTTLFFDTTPSVGQALMNNDEVIQVSEDKPFAVELMWDGSNNSRN